MRATGCQLRELLSQHPTAHTLEMVHERRHRERRWVLDQQMDVVRFAVQLHELEAHLLGDAQAGLVHPINGSTIQHLAPVFHDKDQMNDKPGNAVPTSPKGL